MSRITCGFCTLCLLGLALYVMASVGRADVLMGVDGERFVGKVIEETADTVVFESAIGGRMTIPRGQIRELQRMPPAEAPPAVTPPASSVSTQTVSSLEWLPPGIGHDGFDWIQLKSGEWLKGRLKYIQEKNVEFDSDELEEMTLKLKDVRKIYTAKPMYIKFEGREPVYGLVVVSNDVVVVEGPEPLRLSREDLTGITPGGKTGINNWSGKAVVGLNLQSGNTKETTLNISTELARRTPATEFVLDYLGNFSEVNNRQNANNDRVDANYDIRLDRRWFVRPFQSEYYHDPLANIETRATVGVGLGYNILDENGLVWSVAAGPSYQYTQFETVELGQSDNVTTPAAVLQSRFEADITRRLDIILSYRGTATSKEAGLYTHHAVSTLEFEIKHHLNLDVSFIWDYLQHPQAEDSGAIPQRSDFLLTVGLGANF
jgi:putative salt-induced outer membrane protein YdiY